LFLMCKQNLNLSCLCIRGTQNHWKQIKNEKVTSPPPPKYWGSRTQESRPQHITKLDPQHSKISLYIALLILEFQDDLENLRWCSYGILNHLKWTKTDNVMNFENNRGWNTRKRHFISWKLFFFLLFFLYSFSFTLQRLFIKLEVALP
jgi:hypothetical protein